MNCKNNSKEIDYLFLIKKHFGNVKRARGYYLYTDKGMRLLDMYLFAGRAILGHKPKYIVTQYKRELDRALFGILPYKTKGMVKKALKVLFPNYASACYISKERAMEKIKKATSGQGEHSLLDYQIPTYKYFIKQELPNVFLFLPYPSKDVAIILYKNCDMFAFTDEDILLPQEEVAIARFIHEVIARMKREKEGAILHSMKSKKTLKKERHAQKELASLLPQLNRLFIIEGRYLLFRDNSEVFYQKIFLTALEHSILLSPSVQEPSIFPEIENYNQIKKFLMNV